MLDVPFATHGVAAGFAKFGIKQNPFPPTSRLSAESRIVLLESFFYISRPADICSTIIFAPASQHINKKHLVALGRLFSQDGRRPHLCAPPLQAVNERVTGIELKSTTMDTQRNRLLMSASGQSLPKFDVDVESAYASTAEVSVPIADITAPPLTLA